MRPVQLLRAVRGLTYVELPQADQCCGFGGTFAIKNADVSAALLSDKVRAILDTQAEICTAVDNSCLMHIGGALSRQRAGVRVCTWRKSWHAPREISHERQSWTSGRRRRLPKLPAECWATRSSATTSATQPM